MVRQGEHANGNGNGGGLLDLLTPDIRDALERSRRALDEAAWLRASTKNHEQPLTECEELVREGPPKGRRWKALLSRCSAAISEANGANLKVLRRQTEALQPFQNAVHALRESKVKVPPRVIEMLEECAVLRAEAVEWRERVLRYSTGLQSLSPKTPGDQLIALLAERRRLLTEAHSRERRAERIERAAMNLEELPLEEGTRVETLVSTRTEPAPAEVRPAETVPPSALEGLVARIGELEEELSKVLKDTERNRAEETQRSVERIERLEELQAAAIERETGAKEALQAKLDGMEEAVEQHAASVAEFEKERDALNGRIREAEEKAEAAVAEHEKVRRELEEEVERLTASNAGLEEELTGLKAGAEELAAKAESLDETTSLLETAMQENEELSAKVAEQEEALAESGRMLEEREKELAAKAGELEEAAARAEKAEEAGSAAEGKLKEMRDSLEHLEKKNGELAAAESDLLREREQLEARVADLQKKVAESEAAIEAGAVAKRERDEALALASTLIKRLEEETEKSAEPAAEPKAASSPLADQLSTLRKTIGTQKSELKALKDTLAAYQNELAEQLSEMRKRAPNSVKA